jgi:hypothetical protein
MIYEVDIYWVEEDKEWIAEGVNIPGLCMSANSIDVLVERCNLAVWDLLNLDKFQIKYRMSEPMEVDYSNRNISMEEIDKVNLDTLEIKAFNKRSLVKVG